jgi:hypothetical protein
LPKIVQLLLLPVIKHQKAYLRSNAREKTDWSLVTQTNDSIKHNRYSIRFIPCPN